MELSEQRVAHSFCMTEWVYNKDTLYSLGWVMDTTVSFLPSFFSHSFLLLSVYPSAHLSILQLIHPIHLSRQPARHAPFNLLIFLSTLCLSYFNT